MNLSDVLVARVYITESSNLIGKIIRYLKEEADIRGVSVFRAISGFGDTGELASKFIVISLDLPIAIEFFDSADKVHQAIEHINTLVKPWHIIIWNAKTNI